MLRRFLFIFLFLIPVSLWAQQPDDGRFELWTTLRFTHPIKDSKWIPYVSIDNRFRNSDLSYFLFNGEAGFNYWVLPWLGPGFSYLYETTRGANDFDDFAKENRLSPQLIFAFPLGPIDVWDRNLFELRFFEDNPFRFRYVNQLAVQHTFKTSPVSLTPFIWEQVFIEPDNGGYNQNRLMFGNTFGFDHEKINWGLYYMLREDKISPGNWLSTNVLGTILEFRY